MRALTLQRSPSMARKASIKGADSKARRGVFAIAMMLLRCLGHGGLAEAAAAWGLYDKAIAGLHVDPVGDHQLDHRSILALHVIAPQGARRAALQPVRRDAAVTAEDCCR